jgi:hypothetical protein
MTGFATLLPIACLIWVGAIFIFQAFINATLLHRDIGIGTPGPVPSPMVIS